MSASVPDRAGHEPSHSSVSRPSGDHPSRGFDAGPWQIEPNSGSGSPPSLLVTTQDAVVAEVYAELVASEPVCLANARLISAAPDLYDALLLMKHSYTVGTPQFENGDAGKAHKLAEAALAKARGETA